MTKFSSVYNLVTSKAIDFIGKGKFSISMYNDDEIFTFSTLNSLYKKKQRGFKLVSVEHIESDILMNYDTNTQIIKKSKNRSFLTKVPIDKYGLLKVTMLINKQEHHIIYAKYTVGLGKNIQTIVVCAFEDVAMYNLRKIVHDYIIKLGKPKPGIYDASMSMFGLNITKYKSYLPEGLFDGSKKLSRYLSEIGNYFDNTKKVINGKPVNKSYVLWGTAGTGKTTLALTIAKNLKEKYCIINVSDFNTYKAVVMLCAEYDVPVIIIWEEATDSFKLVNGRSDESKRAAAEVSEIKNFLEGSKMPINNSGMITFYITNNINDMDPAMYRRLGTFDRFDRLSLNNNNEKGIILNAFETKLKQKGLTFTGRLEDLEVGIETYRAKWSYSDIDKFVDWFLIELAHKQIETVDTKDIIPNIELFVKEMSRAKDLKKQVYNDEDDLI